MTSFSKRGLSALLAAILLIALAATGLCETAGDAEAEPEAPRMEAQASEATPSGGPEAAEPEPDPAPGQSEPEPADPEPQIDEDPATPEPAPTTPEPEPTRTAQSEADPDTCPHTSLTPNMSCHQTFRRISEFEHRRVEVTVSYDICNLCGAELNRHETETARSPESHTWGESRFVYDTLEPGSDSAHDRVVHQRSVRECTLCGYVEGETVSEVSRVSEPHAFRADSAPFERTENPTETTHEVVRGTTEFQRCECGFSKERAEKVTYRMVEPHQWEIHTYRATRIENPTPSGHDVAAYEIAYWQCGVCGYTTDYVATEVSRETVSHATGADTCPDCGQRLGE